MNWAYVDTDNNISEHAQLPLNWQNISNFFVLSEDLTRLAELRWYPLENHTLPITNNQLQYYAEATYWFDSSRSVVIKKAEILFYPQDQDQTREFDAARRRFFDDLRSRRNQMLIESDWTQAADLQTIRSQEWKDQWALYRQNLRDLPNLYSVAPFDREIHSTNVNWPKRPE